MSILLLILPLDVLHWFLGKVAILVLIFINQNCVIYENKNRELSSCDCLNNSVEFRCVNAFLIRTIVYRQMYNSFSFRRRDRFSSAFFFIRNAKKLRRIKPHRYSGFNGWLFFCCTKNQREKRKKNSSMKKEKSNEWTTLHRYTHSKSVYSTEAAVSLLNSISSKQFARLTKA